VAVRGHLDAVGEARGNIAHKLCRVARVTPADEVAHDELAVGIKGGPCPGVSRAIRGRFRARDILLLSIGEIPDFITLDASRRNVQNCCLVVSSASCTGIDKKLRDCVQAHVRDPSDRTEAVAFAEKGKDGSALLSIELIHNIFICLSGLANNHYLHISGKHGQSLHGIALKDKALLSKPEARLAILDLIIRYYPREIWPTVERNTAGAYYDAWSSTRSDPRFSRTTAQHRFRAPQERHFLMESGLAEAAAQANLTFVEEVVRCNQWVYGMIRTPGICIMQKRVASVGEPPPGDFRRQVADANMFVRQGNLLSLGDAHASGNQPVHGILIHMTESQQFKDDGYGRPALLRLAFPFGDYSGWAAIFSLEELVAAYPAKVEEVGGKPAKVGVKWKKTEEQSDKDKKSGGK